jgi:hypothetical protein
MLRRSTRLSLALAVAICGCAYDFDKYEPNGTTDARTETSTSGCTEAGSRTYSGHCYFPTTTPVAFAQAKAACESAGAHLVVVTSSGEQSAIESMASGSDRWIGLSRPAGSPNEVGRFTWVTGESPNYFKWDAGEPSGAGECGRMKRGGAWGDSSCASPILAICERERI